MEPSGPGLRRSRSAQCGPAGPFAGLGCRRPGAAGGVGARPSPSRRGGPRTLLPRPPGPARAGAGGRPGRAGAEAQRRAGGGGKWRRAGGTKWRRDPWGWARAAEDGAGGPRGSACRAAGLAGSLGWVRRRVGPRGCLGVGGVGRGGGGRPSPPISLLLDEPACTSPAVGFGCPQRGSGGCWPDLLFKDRGDLAWGPGRSLALPSSDGRGRAEQTLVVNPVWSSSENCFFFFP